MSNLRISARLPYRLCFSQFNRPTEGQSCCTHVYPLVQNVFCNGKRKHWFFCRRTQRATLTFQANGGRCERLSYECCSNITPLSLPPRSRKLFGNWSSRLNSLAMICMSVEKLWCHAEPKKKVDNLFMRGLEDEEEWGDGFTFAVTICPLLNWTQPVRPFERVQSSSARCASTRLACR